LPRKAISSVNEYFNENNSLMKELESHKKNLEVTVRSRTQELGLKNEDLKIL
jgi:hypothetical protein